MDIEFRDPDLDRLETDPTHTAGFGADIVKAFRKRIQFIRDAQNENDLRAMRSWNFEKLKGDRAHQRSIRLNKQWRLIVEIKEGCPKNVLVIVGIEDYH